MPNCSLATKISTHPESEGPHQKRETSVDRSLARVHKVHQKALSAAATLEEEIEKLHRIRGYSQLEVRPKS